MYKSFTHIHVQASSKGVVWLSNTVRVHNVVVLQLLTVGDTSYLSLILILNYTKLMQLLYTIVLNDTANFGSGNF